ncbi:EGF-like domain protein [Teladorsagia circumcincta]|uniref:EGF-like domain protein n=1 Tax=Teladorsagia circumcincta TaxID=45464 RepID=A0A2G9UH97_TELCI|nr:EGF-like domain protein [Teladorsagia circumcincta]
MDYRSNEIQCYCNAGYLLNEIDRHSCQDINECSVGNAGCSQLCVNLPGSYECQCKSGYIMTYDGRTCEDINECVLNNGGCQHSCTNIPGGYKCSCEEGYRLAEDGHSCYDVNECLVNNGGCSQLCRNDEGGRHCECFGGYVLGKDEKTCMDVVTHRKQLDETADLDGNSLDRLIDIIEKYPGDGTICGCEGKSCDPVTGSCRCSSAEECPQGPCPPGFYGPMCELKCRMACPDGRCDPVYGCISDTWSSIWFVWQEGGGLSLAPASCLEGTVVTRVSVLEKIAKVATARPVNAYVEPASMAHFAKDGVQLVSMDQVAPRNVSAQAIYVVMP